MPKLSLCWEGTDSSPSHWLCGRSPGALSPLPQKGRLGVRGAGCELLSRAPHQGTGHFCGMASGVRGYYPRLTCNWGFSLPPGRQIEIVDVNSLNPVASPGCSPPAGGRGGREGPAHLEGLRQDSDLTGPLQWPHRDHQAALFGGGRGLGGPEPGSTPRHLLRPRALSTRTSSQAADLIFVTDNKLP